MSEPLFTDDCYGCVLKVKPFHESFPDWLAIEVTRDDVPDNNGVVGYNAMPPEQIEALRDALTAWLDAHPVTPDPFAGGGSVQVDIGGERYNVSIVGDTP